MIFLRRRWPWLLLALPLLLGVARLRFDVEILNLLPGGVPAVQGLKIYQQNFANARELIVTVRAADAEAAETAARALAIRLRADTNRIAAVTWQPPWLEEPLQSAELIAHLWFNQPPEVFAALAQRLAPTNLATVLAASREQLATSLSPGDIARLSYDPLGLTRLPESVAGAAPGFSQGQELFASADGTFRILFVKAGSDLASYRECLRWLAQVKAAVQATDLPAGVTVNYTGRPAFVAEIAGGMEHDITSSVGTTMLVIVALFWWAHRRWRPLVWLLTLLTLILGGTLALGGLLYGTLSVVSVGFAAILLGLAVDYGLVLYQESLCAPAAPPAELRRTLAPSIVWSAVTTAGAFLILNFSGLPGLAQLGSLVAIGITLAAGAMLCWFLPPLWRGGTRAETLPVAATRGSTTTARRLAWTITGLVLVAAVVVLTRGLPALDHTADSLRPRHSAAYTTLDEIKQQLGRVQEPSWLLVAGRDETEVAQRLDAVKKIVERSVAEGEIRGATLPDALWPRPGFQNANRATAQQLGARRAAWHAAAAANGFTENSLAMTDRILDTWQNAATATGVFWPTNAMSRWVLEKLVARDATNFYALGLIYPATNVVGTSARPTPGLESQLPRAGVWLTGWERLGASLLGVVEHDFTRVMVPMLVLLFTSLWLAFRRLREVLLSLAALLFSLLALLAVMRLAGWSWNLLNLMALPLLLGSGVDYSIHIQLALRRHGGDLAATRRSVGRALLLCAGTTVAGFGSNVWSSNGGLVTLGQVCATGIGLAYLTANYLLPVWWQALAGGDVLAVNSAHPATTTGPSSLYRTGCWRSGLWLARRLSPGACTRLSRALGWLYWRTCGARREIVVQNLLPVLAGDRTAAERTARELFQQFAQKLADLWRYESGCAAPQWAGPGAGWEHFAQAQAAGRGVLLLTPHLGNWEFGAPLLAARKIPLLVITLAEPQSGLTELRRRARERQGIETLVIGDDPFAFVEIIRRLEGGGTVALLVDRPPAASAVTVELFGRPFAASVAAAELARATGCALLPVYLPRAAAGYTAHLLPAVAYDRAALRSREARQALTQEILRAFAPVIRQHPEQWYHFVPIWPAPVAETGAR